VPANRTRRWKLIHHSQVTRRTVLAAVAVAVMAGLAPAAPASAAAPSNLYPIRPGTPAWAALTSHEDMVRVTQLPEGVAEGLSTDGLLSAALDYPLLSDALAFNNVQQGLEIVIARSNGLTELIGRPDAGTALLGRYEAMQIQPETSATELQAGEHTVAVWKVESLLAQPQVLSTMSGEQLEVALRIGRDKHSAKLTEAAIYGRVGLEPTAVLLGRALAVREGWDWRQVPLLRDAIANSSADVDDIAFAVDRHFAEPDIAHPISGGVGTKDRNTIVRTPMGTAVGVIEMSYELTAAQIAYMNEVVRSNYPDATLEANASRKYNCHSYAWYKQGLPNNIWMNTPGDDTYWHDGSYVWVTGSNAGYRWSWPASIDHSAIGTGSGFVRSKWGAFGRVFHWYHYSPYGDATINKYRLN